MKKGIILVVEDDEKIIDILKGTLDSEYTVIYATSIKEAKKVIDQKHIDLICQDIILPDGSGFDLCNEVKKSTSIKVIVLTKKTFISDRIASFNCGADDYIPKPFYPEELKARIDRLISSDNENEIKYSSYILDLNNEILKYKYVKVQLSSSETYVLEFLFKNNGKSGRDCILRYLESKLNKDITPNAFTVLMNRLKQKLDKNIGMKVIKSRYAHGYYIAT